MYDLAVVKTFTRGRKTANAGTKIDILVPPTPGFRTKIKKVVVTNSTTAHTLTCLRPLGQTTCSAAAAAQADVVLAANPGDYPLGRVNTSGSTGDNTPASGDYVVYEHTDASGNKTYVMDTVSSYSSLTLTLATNIPTGGIAAGAKLWFFGVAADTDPRSCDASAHPVFTIPVSGITVLENLTETIGNEEPVIVQENNATAAATVESVQACYGK